MDTERNYEDIIDLPHHSSPTRPRMPMAERAAQFSPFAALTGHGAAIAECARITEARAARSEDSMALLDEKLRLLMELLPQEPEIALTYFVPDAKKEGGAYVEVLGKLKKLDKEGRALVLADGRRIPLEDVMELDGPALGRVEWEPE